MKTSHIKNNNVVITSHTPFLMLGKFSDFNEGSIVCCNIKELYFQSIASKYKDDIVLIYEDKEKTKFNISDKKYKDEKSLISCLNYLILNLKERNLLTDFDGISFSCHSTIKHNEGYELNFLINFIESLNILYELKMDTILMSSIVHKIYNVYFEKTVSLLYVNAFFQDGISYLNIEGNKVESKSITKNLDRFAFVRFIDGGALSKEQNNGYLKSLYDVYFRVKNLMHVNSLSNINYQYSFPYLFGPYSPLQNYEKLVITHYFEEKRRVRTLLEAYTDNDITTKIFDAINMSNYEIGGFLAYNKYKNYLEANVYKSQFNRNVAFTTLNTEATNSFMFIVDTKNVNDLLKYLNTLQNYKFHVCNISMLGIEININK